jgi:hypothetical protein
MLNDDGDGNDDGDDDGDEDDDDTANFPVSSEAQTEAVSRQLLFSDCACVKKAPTNLNPIPKNKHYCNSEK